MPLAEGTQLGPYQILAPVGAGGMGEVYRARDTRLDRTVAVKVLPEHLSKSEEWRQRFDREAKVISRLNHPNICTVHDVGREGDVDYLVLEYIEGETLAARLSKGALPVPKALEYGIQIARGLDKAHRAGIVHRDLKPGNVMLTKAGVKLLDFGLAKELSPAAAASDPDAPTEEFVLTRERTVVGTLHYMAPEQLEARTVDHRADLWALGAVLHEMVSGKAPFGGKTAAGVMAAILEQDPPPLGETAPVPDGLEALIRGCLIKDAEERFQSAHDIELQLRWVATAGGEKPAMQSGRTAFALALLVAAVAVGFVAWMSISRPVAPSATPARVTIEIPAETPIFPVVASSVAVSPDGRSIVYPSVVGGEGLQIRKLDAVEPMPIPGTEGGIAPFFSFDGKWIGFWTNGSLKKIPLDGGTAVTLCPAKSLDGAAWLADGTIVFATVDAPVLQRVSASGGSPGPWTELKEEETSHRWPSALPEGKGVLFAVTKRGQDWNAARIDFQSLDGKVRRPVLEGGTAPRYLPGGYLVFVRNSWLMGTRLDLGRLETSGTPVELVGNLATSAVSGRGQYDVSSNGALVFMESASTVRRQLVWVSRDGAEHALPLTPRGFETPRLSPDGRLAAVAIREGLGRGGVDDADVWVIELERGTLTRLTFDGDEQESPIWRGGNRLTFAASKGGDFARATVEKSPDGSGSEATLATTSRHHHLGSWSPDGRSLVADEFGDNWDVYLYSSDDASPRAIIASQHIEWGPQLSPDGKWLAYTSDETGQSEVYAQDFPGLAGRWQISTSGGREPVWAKSGRELFYRNGEDMISVSIEAESSFRPGPPVVLFSGSYASLPWGTANYDVSADGQRFLMVRGEGGGVSATRVSLFLNWFEELRRLIPAQ